MSHTFFEGTARVNGVRTIAFETLTINGGRVEVSLGDHEGFCWMPHEYGALTKCEKVAILKGRGCPGFSGMRVEQIDRELLHQDSMVVKVGLKNAIAAVRYHNTPVLTLYAEARSRGYVSTEKNRDAIEDFLRKADKHELRKRRDDVVLKAAKSLNSGKIDLETFNALCSSTKELF